MGVLMIHKAYMPQKVIQIFLAGGWTDGRTASYVVLKNSQVKNMDFVHGLQCVETCRAHNDKWTVAIAQIGNVVRFIHPSLQLS